MKRLMRSKPSRPRRPTPTLRFSPPAWAKLLWCRDRGPTEISGFGITSPEDRLRIEDFVLIPQQATPLYVAMSDEAVAEFFEEQVDQGRRPDQFGRIWIHTHPGNCPQPSVTDEETFQRVFGSCDWAVMLIVARGGQVYARLEWHVGPTGAIEVPVTADYRRPFAGSDEAAWQAEFERCVQSLSLAAGGDVLPDFWNLEQCDGGRIHPARVSRAAGADGGSADEISFRTARGVDPARTALAAQ